MTEPTADHPRPARALSPDHPTSPSTAILAGSAVPRHAAGPVPVESPDGERPTRQLAPVGNGPAQSGPAQSGPGRAETAGSEQVVAWQDPRTRRLANRRRALPMVAVVVGVLVAAGCLTVVLTGGLERNWGLPAVVAGAGVAGGCLAGGVMGLIGWARLKGTLQAGAWVPAELEIAAGSRARLSLGADVPQSVELDTRADRLGERGARVPVEVVRDGARTVLAGNGRTRLIRTWPVAERAAAAD